MAWLLDTNIVIAAIKGVPVMRERLREVLAIDLLLSPVVLGELEYGVEKSEYPERNREKLRTVIDGFPLLPLDAETSHAYGRIRASLERQGKSTGGNDLWIAAQALAAGATLVTDNLQEFQRVPDPKVENWLR